MRRRSAFTITELLVAMALIVFIMYILAEAFAAGSTAFRNLKAIGDMNEKLRMVSQVLRKYLSADHFDGRRRLSDPAFWQNGPPQEGFFRIYQGVAINQGIPAGNIADYCSTYEGTDLDGNPSFRSTTHALHFAVKLRGNNRGDFFRASVPSSSPLLLLPQPDTRFQDAVVPGSPVPGIYTSQWSEVAIFLLTDQQRWAGDLTDDPSNTNPAVTPQQLYTLYLRQRPLVTDNNAVTAVNGGNAIPYTEYFPNGNYVQMSCYQDPMNPKNLYFNNPADVTMPARRMGASWLGIAPGGMPGAQQDLCGQANPNTMYPTLGNEPNFPPGTPGKYRGDDIVLTNVLSFDVRILLPYSQWSTYYSYIDPTGGQVRPWPMYDFVSLGTHHAQDPNPNSGVVQQFSGTYYQQTPPVYIRPNNPYFTQFMDVNQPPPNVGFSPNLRVPTWPGFYGYVFDTWSSRKDDGFNFDYSTPLTQNGPPRWATAQGPVPYPAPPDPFTLGPQQSIPLYKTNYPNKQQMAIQILAIQITIRIYDPNTKQTRQTSIVVDM